ncbi:efflux RND transporter periplasmic adaptor subunit [Fibrella sp. WM1]|uniref:efflux RND transporter periplasmic adaptor subunit n=1 Tax=Fibrella musci TaxID=3242485 RepID=UPI0035228CC4
MKKQQNRSCWMGLTLLALGGLAACSSSTKQPAEHVAAQSVTKPKSGVITISEAQFRETGIKLGGPDTLSMGETIQATGKLEAPPDQWASVHAIMGGFVRSAHLVEGDFVHKGQVLAVLEHPDYVKLQQEYLQALAKHSFERQELDRQTELSREAVGARRNLQQSTADFETTKALLASLEAQLAQLHIPLETLRKGTITRTIALRAPISGYVDKVNIRLGQFVNHTDELVEIVGRERLYLELRVFENDIQKVKEGQVVQFTIPQQQTGTLRASVYRVGQAFDPQTKTVLVHANLLANNGARLLAGSYIRATVLVNPRRVATLPEEALVKEGNRSFVYVRQRTDTASAYQFKLIPVQTGISQHNQVEVRLPAGVDAADIVREGAYFISGERAK